MELSYLRGKDIDRQRWDAAVAADAACLPYGFSWWLDAATNSRWDGMVLDDYRVVFPLPRRRSFGRFTQVQRADFTQQGGPFGKLLPGDIEFMLSGLPKSILRFSLPLREQMTLASPPAGRKTFSRTNLVLPLTTTMASLRAGYSRSIRRQLKGNSGGKLSPASIESVVAEYRRTAGPKAGLKEIHYRTIHRIASASLSRGAGYCYRYDDPEHGLLAAGFFPAYRGRIINLFAASTETGYQLGGMSRLLDATIERHFHDAHLLDFEGSDNPGIAAFFKSFGAESRPYLFVE
jgi:hypothetical protein